MCDERSERDCDAELRNVEVPPGLFARLKDVTRPTDSEIATALCSLPVPNGLAARVKSGIADEVLDESLRDVEIPDDLLARLRIIPQRRAGAPLRRLALAASLLLIITGGFFGTLGGLLASIRPATRETTSLYVIDAGPTRLFASPVDPIRISTTGSNLFAATTTPVAWRGGPSRVELLRLDDAPTPGPAGQLIREVERGLELGSDVLLMRWDTYASPQQASQRLPELERIRRQPVAGVDLPMVAGYDRVFLHRTSTHPPVFIGADESLQTIRVPLSTSVASLLLTEQQLALGRVPDPRAIRPEDFLAAIDYDFAPPSDEDVAVSLVAGPARFGSQKHSLVQVGVKALRRVGNAATHISLVVDVSQSMGQQRRLENVRESLRTMFEHLGPEDSLSLVAVNHEVVQQIDFATDKDRELRSTWLSSLRAGGGDRLLVGVQAALSLALEAPCDARVLRQLVVVTDGAARISSADRQGLDRLLEVAAASAVPTTMLQLSDTTTMPGHHEMGDASFATVTPDELPWTLLELATGMPSVVARQVRVQIHFNPKAVRAYRLVGHGPTAVTGLVDETWATDLRSAQQATLLFEVWMYDSYEDEVASATVHWISPDTNVTQQSRPAVLGRYDVVTSQTEAPRSLRMAAIAAEIGERLRGVGGFELSDGPEFRERRKPVSWQDVINAAAEFAADGAISEDFLRLIGVARKLEALRRPQPSTTTL
jgi:Ca-activated chloride channel family protein